VVVVLTLVLVPLLQELLVEGLVALILLIPSHVILAVARWTVFLMDGALGDRAL